MMIEALNRAQDQSLEPQSPTQIIQSVLVGLEPESAHPTTQKKEEMVIEASDEA